MNFVPIKTHDTLEYIVEPVRNKAWVNQMRCAHCDRVLSQWSDVASKLYMLAFKEHQNEAIRKHMEESPKCIVRRIEK